MGFYKRPRTIWLIGDSFQRGFALGQFSDNTSTAHPLWGFAAPDNMANQVLRENAIPIRCIGGLEGLPIGSFTEVGLPAAITSFIASAPVGSDDWMVFEDAGLHNSNPTAYQAALEDVLEAAEDLNRLVLTTFDYPSDHGLGTSYSWDTQFSGVTMNQAIIAAAHATGVPILDMNSIMDDYKSQTLLADGVNPMQLVSGSNDGIHPGVWGQMKMTGAILSALNITPEITSIESLTDIAEANWPSLAAGSPSWSSLKAIDYCEAIFG